MEGLHFVVGAFNKSPTAMFDSETDFPFRLLLTPGSCKNLGRKTTMTVK